MNVFLLNQFELKIYQYPSGNDLSKIKIDFRKSYSNNNLEVNLNGISVENKIRSLEVSDLVSQLAAIDEVRTFMVKIQHSLSKNKGVIMD